MGMRSPCKLSLQPSPPSPSALVVHAAPGQCHIATEPGQLPVRIQPASMGFFSSIFGSREGGGLARSPSFDDLSMGSAKDGEPTLLAHPTGLFCTR